MNWSSVIIAQPLLQRVAKAAGEIWSCLFTGIYLALNGWVRRKWPLQVLVGLPSASTRSAPPRDNTWCLGWLALALGRPERHVVLGLSALALGGSQPTPPHRRHSVWAACPYIGLDRAPRGETWRLSCLPLRWGWLSLPWAGAKPTLPYWDTWRLGCLPLHKIWHERHVVLRYLPRS